MINWLGGYRVLAKFASAPEFISRFWLLPEVLSSARVLGPSVAFDLCCDFSEKLLGLFLGVFHGSFWIPFWCVRFKISAEGDYWSFFLFCSVFSIQILFHSCSSSMIATIFILDEASCASVSSAAKPVSLSVKTRISEAGTLLIIVVSSF